MRNISQPKTQHEKHLQKHIDVELALFDLGLGFIIFSGNEERRYSQMWVEKMKT